LAAYQRTYGWHVRKRDNGSIAFDDSVGQVSGSWVLGRPPATQAGILFYVWVADAPEFTARFGDPAGNLLGLYQEPA